LKVGHLAPIILVADELKKLGVELKLVEFVRYADARTALLAGSLDAASVGPANLAIALAQGSTNVVGLMGVGSSLNFRSARPSRHQRLRVAFPQFEPSLPSVRRPS
jgi:sulfonate transport system substrate-binding protein